MQAYLEGAVAVDGDGEAAAFTGLAVDVVATGDAEEGPAVLLQQAAECFAS